MNDGVASIRKTKAGTVVQTIFVSQACARLELNLFLNSSKQYKVAANAANTAITVNKNNKYLLKVKIPSILMLLYTCKYVFHNAGLSVKATRRNDYFEEFFNKHLPLNTGNVSDKKRFESKKILGMMQENGGINLSHSCRSNWTLFILI